MCVLLSKYRSRDTRGKLTQGATTLLSVDMESTEKRRSSKERLPDKPLTVSPSVSSVTTTENESPFVGDRSGALTVKDAALSTTDEEVTKPTIARLIKKYFIIIQSNSKLIY